jgi:hypothetical protein
MFYFCNVSLIKRTNRFHHVNPETRTGLVTDSVIRRQTIRNVCSTEEIVVQPLESGQLHHVVEANVNVNSRNRGRTNVILSLLQNKKWMGNQD